MKRICAVLSMPLLLSGCMLTGMGGMGSSGGGGMHAMSQASPVNGPAVVKELVVNGIRMTVEFPPYTVGENLEYTVSLRDVRTDSGIPGASISLLVTASDGREQGSPPGQAGAHAEHGVSPPAQPRGAEVREKFLPDAIGNGTYVFHPSIKTGGAYTFTFVLERAGAVVLDPPVSVTHLVQRDSPGGQHSSTGVRTTGTSVAPLVLIGAGAMAVAMLFMFR